MQLHSIGRLRLRLIAWYLGTLSAILVLLGGGLYVTIRRQFARELDASLHEAALELERAARIREQERGATGRVVDAVDELRIPDRWLYLVTNDGRPVRPDTLPAWIRSAALAAARRGAADTEIVLPRNREMRVHAERFGLRSGEVQVAIAVADAEELEDRDASLIAAFGGMAAVALLLVSAGGWLLVRKSTEPIERTLLFMRRFMADAAHELRTPLTVLRSRAEIALQQPRSAPEYAEALRGVEAESQRLGRIVEDLLTLARADAGERRLAQQRVFLDDVVLDAASAAKAMADARGVALRVNEFEEAVVNGDPGLLRQLVMILLDNAVKFTPAGGTVTVRVGTPNERPTFVVADTGIGIAPDQLPHVFERFYRADPARSRGDGGGRDGAGLGLSIGRWIADAHGATIELTSSADSGTEAIVSFPPHLADAPRR